MDAFDNSLGDLRKQAAQDRTDRSDLDVERSEKVLRAGAVSGQFGAIVHDLNNVLISILLNAQVLGWKLPSYSRMKRNVHEVERCAQRGAVLVDRLKRWAVTREGQVEAGEKPTATQLGSGECVADGLEPNSQFNGVNRATGTRNRKKVPHTMV